MTHGEEPELSAPASDVSPPAVNGALMREVMGRFATGVAIVATMDEGQPYAAAVNSLTSVSLDPPLILVCLQLNSRTCRAIERAGLFSVSVLTAEHEEHSRRFARAQPELGDPALEFVDGLPVVRGCLAGMICETESMQVKGDHVVVFGHVIRTHHEHDTPLLFFGSRYHRLVGEQA